MSSLFLIRALKISGHYRKHIARCTLLELKGRPNISQMAVDSLAMFAVFPVKHLNLHTVVYLLCWAKIRIVKYEISAIL